MISVALACAWVIAASVIAMIPSKRNHWPQAAVLIALGLPILALIAWEHGVWAILLALAACASILRWPVRYLLRWIRHQIGLGGGTAK